MTATSTLNGHIDSDVPPLWHEGALAELKAVPRVRAVLITDRAGTVAHAMPTGKDRRGEAEVIDLLMGTANQCTGELCLGPVNVLATLCEEGMLIVASSPSAHVAVLAESEANLGSLLNHVRRIFPAGESK